ncbi:hypothetical protein D3C85_619780 [compost metagenome]
MNHGRGVVLGVFPSTRRVGEDRGTQDVFRQVVGATHAFVDHVVQAHGGAIPTHVHAHADEHGHDAGVLADRAVAGGAHARVDQDLRHGVTGRWRFFAQVGFVHRLDEIHGVVVGNELQGVGNALNQVVLLDHGHESRSSKRREHSIRCLQLGCIGRLQAPFKARRGCWRDAKKARQYNAPRWGVHAPAIIRWSHGWANIGQRVCTSRATPSPQPSPPRGARGKGSRSSCCSNLCSTQERELIFMLFKPVLDSRKGADLHAVQTCARLKKGS